MYCPRKRTVAIESKVTGSCRLPHGAQYHGCMSLKPGQEVRVRSLPSSIDGKITKILPEPDGNDSVVIQISIRRRASDLELIPTPPDRRGGVSDRSPSRCCVQGVGGESIRPESNRGIASYVAGARVAEGSTKLKFRLLLSLLQHVSCQTSVVPSAARLDM